VQRSSRLQQGLAQQIARLDVREALRRAAEQLCEPDKNAFDEWLRQTVLETLGEAMLQACITTAPRHATVDALLVDIQQESETGVARVWITESTMGGAGVLEAFAEAFAAEPRRFFTAIEASLAPTDLELIDGSLRELLDLTQTDDAVAGLLAKLRSTSSHGERALLWNELSASLSSKSSINLSHALSVSLNTRLLRAGAGPDLDKLLILLQERWDTLEKVFGLAIGLREFAFICSRDATVVPAVRTFLSATLPQAAISHLTINAAVTNLLWPRESELRQQGLRAYNPFRQPQTIDPALVRHLLLAGSVPIVDIMEPGWDERLNRAFETNGVCRLCAPPSAAAYFRGVLVRLVATPVNVGFLQFFPVIDCLDRVAGKLSATLALREQV
jgi:hypothetical protein